MSIVRPRPKDAKRTTSAESTIPVGQSREVNAIRHLQRTGGNQFVQRLVQSKLDGLADTAHAIAPPIVHDALAGPSQPLAVATRAFMEPRFGHDFGGVRVHSDAAAAESARAVGAKAYTVGQDIVFGANQFQPNTDAGRRLLAHELTHVMQQGEANTTRSDVSSTTAPVVQREPTQPRAATGTASIADLTAQTAGATTGKVTAGSLARQEWESLFRRHFSEPDKVDHSVESSHARYLYSNIYGWIDAQHFFAHIQFAEDMGLQQATEKGIDIEEKQEAVRNMIGPSPNDTTIYSDFLVHDLIDASDFLHYREAVFMAISAGMSTFLNQQEKALVQGFDDEKLATVILDNAKSAWSYEDLVSNQLGVQFFRLYGTYVNGGKDAKEVRQRFIDTMTAYFAQIQVVNDPATIKTKGATLPGKERWLAPKMTEAQARKKYPELFEFGKAAKAAPAAKP